MVVCRYFLQGYCKFGNRCRFEHTRDHFVEVSNRSNRFAPLENVDKKSPSWDYYYGRYGGNIQEESGRERANRYTWVSPYLGRKELDRDAVSFSFSKALSQSNKSTFGQPQQSSFSFSEALSQVKPTSQQHPKPRSGTRDEDIDRDQLKEELLTWEFGKQWLFTCYAPFGTKMCFPGFEDWSPEEVRWFAYENANNFTNYVQTVQEITKEFQSRREKLKHPTHEMLEVIQSLRLGKDPANLPHVPSLIKTISSSSTPAPLLSASNSNSEPFCFSVFNQDSSIKSSAPSNFGSTISAPSNTTSSPLEVMTIEDEQKSHHSNTSIVIQKSNDAFLSRQQSKEVPDTSVYTPLEELSDKEKAQFEAQRFTLGQIPTRPPPEVLC